MNARWSQLIGRPSHRPILSPPFSPNFKQPNGTIVAKRRRKTPRRTSHPIAPISFSKESTAASFSGRFVVNIAKTSFSRIELAMRNSSTRFTGNRQFWFRRVSHIRVFSRIPLTFVSICSIHAAAPKTNAARIAQPIQRHNKSI